MIARINRLRFKRSGVQTGILRDIPISWLLVSRSRKKPGHQQPLHWIYNTSRSFSSSVNDFKFLGHLNVEWWKIKCIYFCVFWNNFRSANCRLVAKRWKANFLTNNEKFHGGVSFLRLEKIYQIDTSLTSSFDWFDVKTNHLCLQTIFMPENKFTISTNIVIVVIEMATQRICTFNKRTIWKKLCTFMVYSVTKSKFRWLYLRLQKYIDIAVGNLQAAVPWWYLWRDNQPVTLSHNSWSVVVLNSFMET